MYIPVPPQHRHNESENPELVVNDFLVVLVVVCALVIFLVVTQIFIAMLVHSWEARHRYHGLRPVASSRSSLSSLSSLEPLPAYSLLDPEAAPLLGGPPPEYHTFLRQDDLHTQNEARDDSRDTTETPGQWSIISLE
ncbi:hypothetical protein GCG54_00014071 [Colletotrichum gloeosporioides]|uniref:Uncharacterized protein n=1 Tax=Colletotrichum gloeosporioides TaxID=474922 RepID=A0A8H4CTM7_COLGL|nr:uncharacterized protein GCG54_00014071 [Colletotrichum gloeosporioides]KAF3809858.1 hypothetical protein GCG54_00014071 [Colletotrichum gloeosporioides]